MSDSTPDLTFRDMIEVALAEDRPAIMVSLAEVLEDGTGRIEIAMSDGMHPSDVAIILRHAATQNEADQGG